VLLWCVCFASASRAQPLPDRRPISGVVKGADDQPINGATITLRRQDDLNAVAFWGAQVATNVRGEFFIPDAEEGSYYITVEAPNFAPLYNSSYILSQAAAPLQLKLVRLVTLTLRVLKPDGAPLAQGKVVVRLRGDGVQRAPLSMTTDAAGLAQKVDMMPGVYSLHVVASGVGYAVLSNVNVKNAAKPEAVEVRLKKGGVLRVTAREAAAENKGRLLGGASFTMTVAAAAATATQPASQPAASGESALVDAHLNPYATITRDGDGTVEAGNLAPGRYTLRLFLPGYVASGPQTVEIKEGETASANFALRRQDASVALEVLVRNSKGEPVPNTEFSLQLRPNQGVPAPDAINAPPVPPDAPEGAPRGFAGSLRRARSDAGGRIVLYPLKPGKWNVGLYTMQEGNTENRPAVFASSDVTITDKGGSVTVTLPK